MRAPIVLSALALAALATLPVEFVAAADAAPAAAAAPVPGPGPQELMQQVSNDLLKDLDANRETYRKDPKKLRELADRYLLPKFDVEYSARLVLGKYWRTATDAQKKRFIDAFYQSLMRNYSNAMLDFTADRLVILPYKGEPNATQATIRTQIKRDNAAPIAVNYSVHATPKGWLAWDVIIEGVSYVKNYRTDFGAEIDQK
ncbi:MAG TPA: ABC transporter substrate-binding protein, partial [Steroidobacteraceae bacterium]